MATITYVRTIKYVAEILGEDPELLRTIISNDRRPGDERNTRRYIHPPSLAPNENAAGYLRHIPVGSKIGSVLEEGVISGAI